MNKAEELTQATRKGLAVNAIVTKLTAYTMMNTIFDTDCRKAARKGENVTVLRARQIANWIVYSAKQTRAEYRDTIYIEHDIEIRSCEPGVNTNSATGRNQLLQLLQTFSQFMVSEGFMIEFVWEKVAEWQKFGSQDFPRSEYSTDYESKRVITIGRETSELYPELELPKLQGEIKWMQVRPAINIRWECPSDEEVEESANELFRTLTATDEQRVLDNAQNLESADRMLRIGNSSFSGKRKILLPVEKDD